MSDDEIATSLGVGGSTVYRTKRRFVEGNPGAGAERRLASRRGAQAHGHRGSPAGGDRLLEPGHARWTLKLLADSMVKLTAHESLSYETLRRRLITPLRDRVGRHRRRSSSFQQDSDPCGDLPSSVGRRSRSKINGGLSLSERISAKKGHLGVSNDSGFGRRTRLVHSHVNYWGIGPDFRHSFFIAGAACHISREKSS